MKLHLPVKLRASLIAAVIAVAANVYNAQAGTNYVAPSGPHEWANNDIVLTNDYNGLAGNTYTAQSTTIPVFEMNTGDAANVPVGYLRTDGTLTDSLDVVITATEENGVTVYKDADGNYYTPLTYSTTTQKYSDGTTEYTADKVYFNQTGTTTNDADIIFREVDHGTTYSEGSTSLTAASNITFENSFASGVDPAKEGATFVGGQTFTAATLKVNDDNSSTAGSTVVLEDATITVNATDVESGSKLVVLDGATDGLTDAEKGMLKVSGISSTATTDWADANTVALGAVTGGGSLAIIGSKEGSEAETDDQGTITKHAYDVAADKTDAKLTATIASIGSDDPDGRFGNVSIGNADVAVTGSVDANSLTLVNSDSSAADVDVMRLVVDGESTLTATTGNISNSVYQGNGGVSVYGKLVSENGNINLTNGNVYENAHVEAAQGVLLTNVDATAVAKLSAGDNLTVTDHSDVLNSHDVTAGDDLRVSLESSMTDSTATVGDDVAVDGSTISGSTITMTGLGGDDAADTASHDVAVSGASTVSNTTITAQNAGAITSVSITEGSTMADSHILGAAGPITIDGSTPDAYGNNQTVIVGISDANTAATKDLLGADKENLQAILTAKTDDTTKNLTGEELEAQGLTVGSSIESSTGDVTIMDATVSSTLITGGGNVSIGNPAEISLTGTHTGEAVADDGDACVAVETVLTAIDGGTLTDTILAENMAKFPTQVSGSIIDVRNDGTDNQLAINAAAVSNTVILGVNGGVSATDAVIDNSYIDANGGGGLDITHTAVVDTSITNLTADIKISGKSAFTSTSEDGFVLTTTGTADYTDKDDYTGGSIILEDTTMSNGTIKSGVVTTVDADGNYVFTDAPTPQVPSDPADPDSSLVDVEVGTINGATVPAGTTLPYGEISVTGSSLTDMTLTTAKGNIGINASSVQGAEVASAGNGAISITDSLVDASTVKNAGAGDINILNSTVSTNTLVSTNSGNVVIDTNATTPVYTRNDRSNGCAGFTGSLSSITASAAVRGLDTISIQGRNDNAASVEGVRLAVYDGDTLIATSDAITFKHNSTQNLFTFDGVDGIDPDKQYTFRFVDANGNATTLGVDLRNSLDADTNKTAFLKSDGTTNNALGLIVRVNPITQVVASTVKTDGGYMQVWDSIVKSDVLTSEDADGNAVSTYTKSHLLATSSGLIDNSSVSGTNVTISNGGLTIQSGSSITQDVNIISGGQVYVQGASEIAMDGAGNAANPDQRDASITAQSLKLESMKDAAGYLANGQIAIANTTYVANGQTFTLDNVHNTTTENDGTLAETAGTLGDLVGYWGNDATLNVQGGSIIEAGKVHVESGEAIAPANASTYFGTVNVSEDSEVTVKGHAQIRNYTEGSIADGDTNGSKVSFLDSTHLTNATIKGVDAYEGDAVGSVGTVTSILADGHVGNLNITNKGVLSLNAGAKADASTHSYISNIGDSDGTINVINQTLSTPELDHSDLSLGLNGGTVVLAGVAAADGATVASTKPVDPHVSLLEITNASNAGAPDQTPYGASTIQTTLSHVVTMPTVSDIGTPTDAAGKRLYFVVKTNGTIDVTGQNVYALDANGDKVLVTELTDGMIVVRDTIAYDTTQDVTMGNGSVLHTAVTTDELAAVTLSDTERTYLFRITVPVLDENGQPVFNEIANVLEIGQEYTDISLSYNAGAVYTPGTTGELTDGIASLTLEKDMDSDNTTIKAYEIAQVEEVMADDGNGNMVGTGTYLVVKDADGNILTDAASGKITIKGVVSGQDNTLIAARDVTIGGIVTNEDAGAEYSNHNMVTSTRGNVVIGAQGIVGSTNSITAEAGDIRIDGDTNGNSNVMNAFGDITTRNITGNSNSLTAGENVTVIGALKGDTNSLEAKDGSVIITGGILADADGSSNGNIITSSALSEASKGVSVIALGATDGDSLVGSNNELTANGGDIRLTGDIEGSGNKLVATYTTKADGTVAGGTIDVDDITGSNNELTADDYIDTANITGNENKLTAGTSITVHGALRGDENELEAGTTIDITKGILADVQPSDTSSYLNKIHAVGDIHIGETDGISVYGNENVITSDEGAIELDGSMIGNANDLDAATTIAIGGDIEGSRNDLDAVQDITVGGDINGNGNMLTTTEGDIIVDGSIIGSANDLQSHQGSILVKTDVMGTDAAAPNTLTAADPITIQGTLGGVGTQVTTYAQGLSQDDVAISIGVFAAQGTDLTIATTTSPIYGEADGDGKIVIGSMNAAVDATGTPVAAVDATLVNNIVSNNSYVEIGGMKGSNAYTTITAAKDVLIGTATDTVADTGANLRISGTNLRVNSGAGLTLTDSTIRVTGDITGTSLTLTTSATVKAPVVSTVLGNVTLEDLTLQNFASLDVTGTVTVENLTLDGKGAILEAFSTVVTDTLTLKGDAKFDSSWVSATSLVFAGDATYEGYELDGIENLTVTNGAKVTIKSDLELADDPDTEVVGGNLVVNADSTLTVTDTIDVTSVTVTGARLNATNGLSANGATATTTVGSVDVTTVVDGDVTVTADSGTAAHISGTILNAHNVTVDGSDAVTKSSIGDVAYMTGDLVVTNGKAGDVYGANKVVLNSAEVGDITANIVATLSLDDMGDRDFEATNSTVGSISNYNDVILVNTTVHGSIAMDGELNMSAGSAGDVAGATGATLTDAATIGNLTLVGDDADVDATGGSITSITGANDVMLDGTATGAISMDGVLDMGGASSAASVTGATDATLTGSSVSGTLEMDGVLTMTEGSSAGSVSGATEATLDVSTISGALTMAGDNGDVTATDSSIGSIVNANDVTLVGTTVAGDVAMDGELTQTGGSIGSVTGTVTGATISGSIGSDLTVDDGSDATKSLTTLNDGATINGKLTAEDVVTVGDVTVRDGVDASGDMMVTGGTLTANGTDAAVEVDGTLTFVTGEIVATNGVTAGAIVFQNVTGELQDLTVTTGDLSLSGGNSLVVTNDVDVQNGKAILSDSASLSTVEGGLTSNGLEATGNSTVTIAGGIDLNNGGLTLENSTVNGDVTEAGAVSLTQGSTVNGDISGATDATVSASTIDGDLAMGGTLAATNATITGDVTGATDASLVDTTVNGDLTMSGELDALGSTVVGSVTGATDVTLADSTVNGDIAMTGTLTAGEGSVIAGSVTGADYVDIEGAQVGDITTAGTLWASDHNDVGDVVAGKVVIDGSVQADSLLTGDLTVWAGQDLVSLYGDVTADGSLSIDGAVTANYGNVNLTGDAGSTITAPVTADEDVTLGGTIDVSGTAVTAGETLAVNGTISTVDTTLAGAEGVVVAGTLNAGEGTVIEGTLTGAGTINKTGGDALVLAGDTNLTGALNVSDASTISVEDGAQLGNVALTAASTMEITPEGATGSVTTASISASADSVLKADLDLAARAADTVVAGTHDYNGATLELATVEPGQESGIADQTRITVADGTISSSINEDITHTLDTLNAHAENMGNRIDIVLSKNYKGAEKTENQSQVAAGLASVNAEAVAGTELGKVLDAMAHTRSEADAVAALDSLGGMGYAGLQKLIADDAHEHLQTLRSTLDSVAADVRRRFDANGNKIEGVQSSAFAAVVTGGTSEVGGNGNCGDYSRNSFGAMVAGAHAVSNEWTFGADLAYSYVDGDCSDASFSGDAIYFDVAMMQKRGRFTQTGTIGAGIYRFDLERQVSVKAPGHDYSGYANGSTNAAAINLSYEATYDLIRTDDGHAFSSLVMAEASFVQIDGMSEEGMGNAGLRSEFDDMTSITLGVGGRYTYNFGEASNPGYFAVEAMLVVDAGDDTPKVHNQFIGGGQTFDLAGPEAGDIGLRLNAGLLIPVGEQWGVFGNVTSEFRSEQSSVGGGVGVKYSF